MGLNVSCQNWKVLLSTVTASTPLRPSAMSGTVVVPKRNAFKTDGES